MLKLGQLLRWTAILSLALTFCCLRALAQAQTGEILGVVTDATGAAVPGATVTITSTDTGTSRTIKTDDQGRYEVADLNIGNYQVQAEMKGFAPVLQRGLVLAVGQRLVTDFKLQVGTVTQEVTVEAAAAPAVNTTSSEVGTLVNESQMQNLPLNGRNYEQLFSLVPGVQPVQATSNNAVNIGSSLKFSVAGSRVTGEAVLLDGVEIRGMWGQGAGLNVLSTSLGIDGIAEFQTMTSSFNAQYNGLSVMNEVTRSGGNSFHGSAYGFFRNSAMNTRNYFDPVSGPPAAHYNQFGGAIGGPIRKNKTFFFANYEGLRATLTLYDGLESPDANALQGYLPCAQEQNPKTKTYDFPCVASGTYTGYAFVGVNPNTANILNLYKTLGVSLNPAATEVTSGGLPIGSVLLTVPGNEPEDENFLATKIDHQISSKNSVAFRYVVDSGGLTDPWPNGGSAPPPGNLGPFPNQEQDIERNQYVTVQDRHIFSDSLINVASSSFVRTREQDRDSFAGPDAAALVNELTFIPGRLPGVISVTGAAAINGTTKIIPGSWIQNVWTQQDEVDWVHGAHTFKFGGTVSRTECNCQQNPNPGGLYTFSATAGTGPWSGLESLLLDKPASLVAPAPGLDVAERNGRQTNISGYIQDDWKATSRLTFNLGLRDDFVTNPTEANNLIYRIVGTALTPFSGYTHEPRYFASNPSTRNIDPRVGFAWDVFGDHKTSVRSGFGIFHSIIYPRDYMPGMTFDYPVIQANQSCPSSCPSFPNPSTNGFGALTPGQSRSQHPWTYCCTSYQMEYNFTIERQLPKALTLSLGYVGSGGVHLIAPQEANVYNATIVPGSGHPGDQFRNPAAPPSITYPAFTDIDNETPQSNSHYNSMMLGVNRTARNGITLQSAFTWSKCIDWGSSGVASNDVSNDSTLWLQPYLPSWYNKGPCAFNVGKNWTSNALVPLPFHGNWLKSGWQIGLIASARTGSPVTPTESIDQGNLGVGYFSFGTDRPDINPAASVPLYQKVVKLSNGAASSVQWFNPNYFVLQAAGFLGDARRGMITGPGFFDMDTAVMKTITLRKLGESSGVQLRGDFFNVFNHTNLQLPGGGIFPGTTATPTFITATVGNSRNLQVSAKLVF